MNNKLLNNKERKPKEWKKISVKYSLDKALKSKISKLKNSKTVM